MQHSARQNSQEIYDQYAAEMNDQSRKLKIFEDCLILNLTATAFRWMKWNRQQKLKRLFPERCHSVYLFEAHTNLAIAMGRIGGKSNTGEGGEQPERFEVLANGDTMRSAMASSIWPLRGDDEYLRNSDEIQIKIERQNP